MRAKALQIMPFLFILSACSSPAIKTKPNSIDVNTATYQEKYDYIIRSLYSSPISEGKKKALKARGEYLSFKGVGNDPERDMEELPKRCLYYRSDDSEIASCTFVYYTNGLVALKREVDIEKNGLVTDSVPAACRHQGIFYSFASIKAMSGIDNGSVALYGKSLRMSEAEINKVVSYLRKNQEEAMLYQKNDFTPYFIRTCMINPKRYVATYDRIFN